MPDEIEILTARFDESLLGTAQHLAGVNFLQDKIFASHDVRVQYIDGDMISWQLDRLSTEVALKAADNFDEWRASDVPSATKTGLRNLANKLSSTQMSVEFLRTPKRDWFLELNPRGDFLWLDHELKATQMIADLLER